MADVKNQDDSTKHILVTRETTVLVPGLLSITRRKILDFTRLGSLARKNWAADGAIELRASADFLDGPGPELTGEQLLLFCRQIGVPDEDIAYKLGDDGVIDEITASVPTHFEYDPHEMGEVLESLQATGVTPTKIVGDLAQTSVGASGSEVQVIGLSEWTISWKRKTADATTTDYSSYESSLPSTASWSVKAKYMFIDGDPSQQTNILATITTLQTTTQTWNFFPTIAQGRSAFSGQAYVDSIDIASGMGKCVGLDVSLKGNGPLFVLTQVAPQANANTQTGQQAEV